MKGLVQEDGEGTGPRVWSLSWWMVKERGEGTGPRRWGLSWWMVRSFPKRDISTDDPLKNWPQ